MTIIKCIRENIIKLMKHSITKEQLLKKLNIDENQLLNVVVEMLDTGSILKDAALIEDAIYLIFLYNLNLNNFINTLNALITVDWHEQHENIAILLQNAKDSSSVNPLYTAANMSLEYLSYDEHYALAVKCIWGLAKIGNTEAISKLELLSKSQNIIIADNASKQLTNIIK